MFKILFRPILLISIILVYIVIIAGAVVRMTGSGMGCPDWPKCFGYSIPPTNASQLQWKINHNYKKGQKIIREEQLFVVKRDFVSKNQYNANNWERYAKHDYAIFNPVHTWIEYINRLATVLFGIPLLFLFVLSLFQWSKDKRYAILSFLTLISVGIEAVLGKIVVDTNLQPVKITLHVLFVFFIVAFLLGIRFLSKEYLPVLKNYSRLIKPLAIAVIFVTLIQVTLGTQLRQYIDVQMQLNAHKNQNNWLSIPPIIFYIHRSFSVVVVIINLCWVWLIKKANKTLGLVNWIVVLLFMEVLSGIVLYYLDFPFLSQPIHLLLSSLLFGVQFYTTLRLFKK